MGRAFCCPRSLAQFRSVVFISTLFRASCRCVGWRATVLERMQASPQAMNCSLLMASVFAAPSSSTSGLSPDLISNCSSAVMAKRKKKEKNKVKKDGEKEKGKGEIR